MKIFAEETINFKMMKNEDWNNLQLIEKIVNAFETAQKIITQAGEHPRIEWKSGYHDVLTWHCKSQKKADILFKAFNQAFLEMPESSDKESIREFIKRNQIFIGRVNVNFNFSTSSISYLANDQFKERFNTFFAIVRNEMELLYPREILQSKTTHTVLILTCNAGNGHKAVANAVKDMFHKKGGSFKAIVLNVDEDLEDSLKVITNGLIKTSDIFSKIRCQEGNDKKANLYIDLVWALNQFIPNNHLDDLNRRICELKADILISTIHHETFWFAPLSDLNVPFCCINTDYELLPQLKELKAATNTTNFKIFTPIDYQLQDPGIVTIGYPIRPGFEQPIEEAEKLKIKAKYGVKEGEFLIVLQMGGLAMGLEKEVGKLIKETEGLQNKCHAIFLCANNEDAKKAILTKQASNPNLNLQLHVEGMLNDIQMATLYGTAQAIIGKSGGATTAEILAVKDAYLLVLSPLPWERPNLSHLQKLNKGREITDYQYLKYFLSNKIRPQQNSGLVLPDWKKRLTDEITALFDSQLKKSYQSFEVNTPFSNMKLMHFFVRYCQRMFSSWDSIQSYFKFLIFKAPLTTSPLKQLQRLTRWWKYA